MKITTIKIGLHQFSNSTIKRGLVALRNQLVPVSLYQDENNYIAQAIEHEGQYFYQVNGVTVQALKHEYERTISNPRLHYFSSALKLHFRVKKARNLGQGLGWPEQAAAPINVCELGK